MTGDAYGDQRLGVEAIRGQPVTVEALMRVMTRRDPHGRPAGLALPAAGQCGGEGRGRAADGGVPAARGAGQGGIAVEHLVYRCSLETAPGQVRIQCVETEGQAVTGSVVADSTVAFQPRNVLAQGGKRGGIGGHDRQRFTKSV